MRPRTRYAKSGDVSIAYQIAGDGPLDLIYVPGWVSHIELAWEEPSLARMLERLASFSRLILFDKRGTGLSDRVPESKLPTLEQRMDDVRAVMEAAGSEEAAIFGWSEGGNMSMLFAATYPERTIALITCGAFAKRLRAPDYPWAPTQEQRQAFFDLIEGDWGGTVDLPNIAPSAIGNRRFEDWWAGYLRAGASPGAALALARMNTEIDVRHVLPAIAVPTLVLHRTGDLDAHVEEGRFLAQWIPGAKFVELPGSDHLPFVGDVDSVVDEIEEFLTGARGAEPDRVLTTVMFIDLVGSTERAAELGDRRWKEVLESYRALVRAELARFRGREVETAGDGFLARFDGPARAIRCACAVIRGLEALEIGARVGLHTGECEVSGDKLAGIAVHTGARVATLAEPGEVLVSSTVKDLVAGSGIRFTDRGRRVLKGVPGRWRLFAVEE
jgi:class 3 adenylate cyclase/pimeloyl-ACP methyl ester carboxylesterase